MAGQRRLWESCDKKRGYKSARHAHRAADRAAHKQGRSRELLRAYECRECFKWHLTKKGGTR